MLRSCLASLVLVLAAAVPAQADVQISLARENATGVTHIQVQDLEGRPLAAASWSGDRPLGTSPDNTKMYSPATLVAQLRDDAAARGAESDEAHGWALALLGPLAGVPTVSVPRAMIAALDATGTETVTWCGRQVSDNFGCPTGCTSGSGVDSCAGCGCRGQITRPVDPKLGGGSSLEVAR